MTVFFFCILKTLNYLNMGFFVINKYNHFLFKPNKKINRYPSLGQLLVCLIQPWVSLKLCSQGSSVFLLYRRRKIWRGRQPWRGLNCWGCLGQAFSSSSTGKVCLDMVIFRICMHLALRFSIWPYYVKQQAPFWMWVSSW